MHLLFFAQARKKSFALQNVFSYYRMCSLTTECVLLLQNVLSYYRMCSLTKGYGLRRPHRTQNVLSYYRMCSLTTECVLLLQNVFSYYRMCFLTTAQDTGLVHCGVFSYYRMCSLTTECVLLLQNVFSYYRTGHRFGALRRRQLRSVAMLPRPSSPERTHSIVREHILL
jgi:hypothetical protein